MIEYTHRMLHFFIAKLMQHCAFLENMAAINRFLLERSACTVLARDALIWCDKVKVDVRCWQGCDGRDPVRAVSQRGLRQEVTAALLGCMGILSCCCDSQ